MHYNHNPRLTPWLIHQDFWDKETGIFFVDVGCSGGLFELCPFFEGRGLKAVGFDPLVDEIERLKSENKDPNIRYESAFVLDNSEKRKGQNDDHSDRFSAGSAMEITEYQKQKFNRGKELVHSDRSILLDQYFFSEKNRLDFLKIDTDGSDHLVLQGTEKLLKREFLGIQVEIGVRNCVSTENSSEKKLVLSQVHDFLFEKGFILFNWQPVRYSRRTLPDLFCYPLPAQTFRGQIQWADFLYFRDLGDPNYEKEFPDFDITPQRVLNSICLYELYDLNDCAVEVVLKYQERCSFLKDPKILDLLTPRFRGRHLSYNDYMELFRRDYKNFYPIDAESKYSDSSTTRLLEWIHRNDEKEQNLRVVTNIFFQKILRMVLTRLYFGIQEKFPGFFSFLQKLLRKRSFYWLNVFMNR